MLWYNKITNELTNGNPWGDGYFRSEKIEEFYPDWQQVADEFIPPVPVPNNTEICAPICFCPKYLTPHCSTSLTE